MKRRKFIGSSVVASTSLMTPIFFTQCASNKKSDSLDQHDNGKKVIVIQLSGGNDGVNTVVPFENDIYYASRPNIHIPKKEVIKVGNELGFNPALAKLSGLFSKQELTVINSIGYPNADRSHFRSMDIWHSGFTDLNKNNTGWIGRYLDHNCESLNAIEIDDTLSLALKGQSCNGFSLSSTEKLKTAFNDEAITRVMKRERSANLPKVDFLYKTLTETQSSAKYIINKTKNFKSTVTYPKTKFGQDLRMISKLITADLPTKIYYASLSGFDTHARQRNKHTKLLTDFSSSTAALVQDLKNHGLFDDTIIMVFSEFGRRLKENGSMGTDHGKGNNLFLIGSKLASAGFYNRPADLKDLDEGDISFEIDFRQVYRTVLEDWLDSDGTKILDAEYSKLNLFS